MRWLTLVLAVLALGCGGAQQAKGTLTLGAPSAPASLDPAVLNTDPSSVWFARLAYDSLLELGPDQQIQPGLATRWGYVDKTTFELELRTDVTFSDGSPVDAHAAVTSLKHWLQGGTGGLWADEVTNVTAIGTHTVRIECETPNPELPKLLTWQGLGGIVFNPKHEQRLGTITAGSGPYQLDPQQTVTGSRYTFVRNPRARTRPAADQVVIRVYADQNAALSALRSGAVDVLAGATPSTARGAERAGLDVTAVPAAFAGVNLIDRTGELQPALKDQRVRQALKLAINQAEIAKSLFGDYAEPYDDTPYDPDRARRLLGGRTFDLQLTTPVFGGTHLVAQAVAGYWKAVGVSATVKPEVGFAAWAEDAMSKRYAATGFVFAAVPLFLEAKSFFAPRPNPNNVWATEDAQLTRLLEQHAAADIPERAHLERRARERAAELAWVLPVVRLDTIYASRAPLDIPPGLIFVDPRSLTPQ